MKTHTHAVILGNMILIIKLHKTTLCVVGIEMTGQILTFLYI